MKTETHIKIVYQITKTNKKMKTKNNAQGEKRTGSKLIACSQILILVIASFAFSYLISQSSAPLKTESEITKDSGNANIGDIWTFVRFIFQKLKQPILPIISAEESLADWACCEKNNNGN